MDLALLLTLKEKLAKEKELAVVFEYFLDHFAEDLEFIELGQPVTEHPFLMSMLGEIGGQLFKTRAVRLDALRLIRLDEYPFIHGGCLMNGKLATILYFDDVKQGLLAVVWSRSPSETKFARFSAQPLPNWPPPMKH